MPGGLGPKCFGGWNPPYKTLGARSVVLRRLGFTRDCRRPAKLASITLTLGLDQQLACAALGFSGLVFLQFFCGLSTQTKTKPQAQWVL